MTEYLNFKVSSNKFGQDNSFDASSTHITSSNLDTSQKSIAPNMKSLLKTSINKRKSDDGKSSSSTTNDLSGYETDCSQMSTLSNQTKKEDSPSSCFFGDYQIKKKKQDPLEKEITELVKLQKERLVKKPEESESKGHYDPKFTSEKIFCDLVYSELIQLDKPKREENKAAIMKIIYSKPPAD